MQVAIKMTKGLRGQGSMLTLQRQLYCIDLKAPQKLKGHGLIIVILVTELTL